jgi:uncharacterized protein (TIRG00374 family)
MDISRPIQLIIKPRKPMDALETPTPKSKKNILRYLLILLVLGLAVNVLLPRIGNLQNALSIVESMTWWAVLLAILAEVSSYFGYGFTLASIMAINNKQLLLVKGALIALASASIGLVAGGWVGASATTFGFMRKNGADRSTATMAGVLPSILLNGVIEAVAIVGIIVLFMMKKLSQTNLAEYIVFLVILATFSFSGLLALYFTKAAFNVVNWVLWYWARFKKKPYDPEKTYGLVNNYIATWKALGKGRWKKPLLGAAMNISFDMLCLYFFFVAAGYQVNPGVLFAGYGIPLLIAKIAFLLPGGIGIIEASMAAIFKSLGVPGEVSAVVIIGYRLTSFWMPMILGFPANGLLSRMAKNED